MQFIHKATIWKRGGSDIYGRPLWLPPIVMNCRWEERSSTYVNNNGVMEHSRARIYLAKRVKVGDYIAKGVFTNIHPYEPDDSAVEIRDFREINNVTGDRVEYRALI